VPFHKLLYSSDAFGLAELHYLGATGFRRDLGGIIGDFIDAHQALEWGLVNRVCPAAELGQHVNALAARLIAKPREVLALGKALFYRQLEAGLAAAYADASKTIACNMAADVAKEGVDAFLAKRPPNWKR